MPLVKLGALLGRERKKFEQLKSRKALAAELGVSAEHIRRLEKGEAKCSYELLRKILVDQLTVPKAVEDEAFWLWIQGQVPKDLRYLLKQRKQARGLVDLQRTLDTLGGWLDTFYDIQLSDADKASLCALTQEEL